MVKIQVAERLDMTTAGCQLSGHSKNLGSLYRKAHNLRLGEKPLTTRHSAQIPPSEG